MSKFVWLSGEFIEADRALISATSTSVTFGVGLYETLRVVNREAPLLDLHLQRLEAGCRFVGLSAAPCPPIRPTCGRPPRAREWAR